MAQALQLRRLKQGRANVRQKLAPKLLSEIRVQQVKRELPTGSLLVRLLSLMLF